MLALIQFCSLYQYQSVYGFFSLNHSLIELNFNLKYSIIKYKENIKNIKKIFQINQYLILNNLSRIFFKNNIKLKLKLFSGSGFDDKFEYILKKDL